jgi:hypothetical protein
VKKCEVECPIELGQIGSNVNPELLATDLPGAPNKKGIPGGTPFSPGMSILSRKKERPHLPN